MSPHLTPQAKHLLSTQDNVIAVWQDGAPSRRAMARANTSGAWRRLTHHTYLASRAEASEQQQLWAAALHAGQTGMLSGQAALVCHGWTGNRSGPIDVLADLRHTTRVPAWMRVHRTTIMPRASKGGIPRAIPQAATIDATSWAGTAREAEFLVLSVLSQKLCTSHDLERVLADRPSVKHRRLLLGVIKEFRDGVHSMGELDFSRLCREHGIRTPDRQVWRYGARGERRRLDVYFDAEGVVVEIDGIGHTDLETWIDDQERQNEVVISGDRLFLRVSNWALRYEPEVFMDQLQRALRQDWVEEAI